MMRSLLALSVICLAVEVIRGETYYLGCNGKGQVATDYDKWDDPEANKDFYWRPEKFMCDNGKESKGMLTRDFLKDCGVSPMIYTENVNGVPYTYKPNLDCQFEFDLKQGKGAFAHIFRYDIKGDPAKNCEGGDYFQFVAGDIKAERLCGKDDSTTWSYKIGPFDKDVTVKGIFHSNGNDEGRGLTDFWVAELGWQDSIDNKLVLEEYDEDYY